MNPVVNGSPDFPTTFYTAIGKRNFAAPFAREIPLLEGHLQAIRRENIRKLAESWQAGANTSCTFTYRRPRTVTTRWTVLVFLTGDYFYPAFD